jgi:4,5-DOPA dioxygenase extradiol
MPALFLGHGSPMNAITESRYSASWRELGCALPRPKSIVCVSAHWFTRGTGVTVAESPVTIHDFYGFPPELYAVEYPAPGNPALAERVAELLQPTGVIPDESWGLDHGAWSLLTRLYPEADTPVIQLSIDGTQPACYHYELAQRLAPLRDEGVLVLGSGNVIHGRRQNGGTLNAEGVFEWAAEFEAKVRDCILRRDHQPLLDYEEWGLPARLAVPTPEHYLPLIYVLGLAQADDEVCFPVEGIEGAMSMLGVRVG